MSCQGLSPQLSFSLSMVCNHGISVCCKERPLWVRLRETFVSGRKHRQASNWMNSGIKFPLEPKSSLAVFFF